MRKVADVLKGEHDFASFRASGCSSRDARRRIGRIDIVRRRAAACGLTGGGWIVDIIVEGNGFVRHMIRNIVGTLVDVGRGRFGVAEVKAILSAGRRERAGRCAPACGLYLEEVVYG